MKKWIIRLVYAAVVFAPIAATADYLATPGGSSTVFSFVCSATKICPAMVLIDSSNVEKGTAGNPVRVDPTGTTTQPTSVVGTAAVTQSGTWNVNNIAGTVSLPTGASTSANQTNSSQKTQVVDGSGNVIAATSNALNVDCVAGCSASTSITGWAGGTLGAMANYGTAPAAVLVPGVNAFVTNATPLGQAVMASSSPVVIASNQSSVPVTASADVCQSNAKTNLAISQSGTSSIQLIALSGATTIYVCSLSLIAAGATTVAITTGTGTACVTGNAAVIGTTTASIANSISFAANGGMTLGSGVGTIAKGASSSELCMVLGTNVFVSGNLTYVQL